jgi:hypothetical protein
MQLKLFATSSPVSSSLACDIISISVCSVPLRSPSPAYSIDSNLSNISLDEAKAVRAIAFALLDQPGLAGPVETLEPKADDSSEYSTDREYPFDIPVLEWETLFPDEFICFDTVEEALEALQKWARNMGYEEKG